MTDFSDDGTIRAHWPPLPKVLDPHDPDFVETLKQSVRYLQSELYRVQAERDRLREETGWLIERPINIQTQWLWKHDGLYFEWTTDSNEAMRFSRREDADNLCGLFENEDVRITEHCWPRAKESSNG